MVERTSLSSRMFYTSKGLAVLLSGCISLVTTICLLLVGRFNISMLSIVFIAVFVIGFFLIFFTLEYLIFRDIKKINNLVDQLNMKDLPEKKNRGPVSLNPFQKIRDGIHSFADRKQKEMDRLKNLEVFRKDFIANVSHELKTPIFAAQGFVHTLIDGAVKDKAVRKKFLNKAAKSLDDLDILVQDLLTLSQIETGQIKMHFEEIDLYTLTEEVFDQFRVKPNKKEVLLRIEGPVRKVVVYADWLRISQVMTNLISNAIKHSGAEGEVVVKFILKKKSVVTRVTDFGEGIPAEHIHRIFERFYRVDKSRSREKGGTGLGLAIVKHILDGHHSKAEVESEPGKGSAFSFKLPRTKTENTENAEPDNAATS